MIMTHEEVLAQLQIQFQTHRDIRIYHTTFRPGGKAFVGYRVTQLDTPNEGQEWLDFYLAADGWRTRRWVRAGNVITDPVTNEQYNADLHGAPGKEVSTRYLTDNIKRLQEEKDQ